MNSTVIVVGSPRAPSRTSIGAGFLASALTPDHPPTWVTLAAMKDELANGEGPRLDQAIKLVQDAKLLISASPTYKATYTGWLKLFFDLLPADALRDVMAVPLMIGGSPVHSLAPEVYLRPLLNEVGASTLPGLYLVEPEIENSSAIREYADRWHKAITAHRETAQ